jgi:hypothetical protein
MLDGAGCEIVAIRFSILTGLIVAAAADDTANGAGAVGVDHVPRGSALATAPAACYPRAAGLT